mmetsp:Transcript_22407/g.51331  ORF Transcript_22407/g.51331 Transcript_22407/m.51331 type:complete len:170 (-) Transcript_22407:405-914(-)
MKNLCSISVIVFATASVYSWQIHHVPFLQLMNRRPSKSGQHAGLFQKVGNEDGNGDVAKSEKKDGCAFSLANERIRSDREGDSTLNFFQDSGDISRVGVEAVVAGALALPLLFWYPDGIEIGSSARFAAYLLLHWALWSKASPSVALLYDLVGIMDVLYESSLNVAIPH